MADLSIQDIGWILAASIGVVIAWALVQAAWYHRATLGATAARATAVILPGTVRTSRHLHSRVMSRWERAFDDFDYNEDAADVPHNNNHNNSTTVIAEPQRPHNDLLRHNEQEALVVTARAVIAATDAGLKTPDGGNLTETKAIKIIAGLSPGSTNRRYQDLVAAIRAERATQARREQHVTPIAQRPTAARFLD